MTHLLTAYAIICNYGVIRRLGQTEKYGRDRFELRGAASCIQQRLASILGLTKQCFAAKHDQACTRLIPLWDAASRTSNAGAGISCQPGLSCLAPNLETNRSQTHRLCAKDDGTPASCQHFNLLEQNYLWLLLRLSRMENTTVLDCHVACTASQIQCTASHT